MSSINQEDLMGEFIPDVFIGQIVLESSGTPLVDNNPHIDTESEKRTQTTNDNLNVTLKIVMKEKLSDDLITNWISSINIQKYLKVTVYQSTDPKTTALLSLSQDMIELVQQEKSVSQNDIRFKMAGSVFETDKSSKVLDKLRNVKSQTLVLGNKKLSSKSIDDDGNEVFNLNYTVKFSLNDSFPEHLAYFAISSFDVQKLAQDFDLEYDTISMEKMNGKVVSDVVIDGGDLVGRSFVFYDPDAKIWSGAVHLMPSGQWRSKSVEQQDSINLTRDTVTNNKIQDFRNVKDIQKLQFDFSGINKKLNEIDVRASTNDKMTPIKIESFSFL